VSSVVAQQLEGVSPEGVFLSVPLANAGSRTLAGGIDLAIQGLLLVGAAYFFQGERVAAAFRAVSLFLVLFLTPILFDVLDSGRGPGKRAMGLRVVTTRGGPVSFRASVIRNLLRLVDFLPFGYLLGITSVVSTEAGQRLGDIAAGTVVTIKPGRIKTKPVRQTEVKLSRRERKRLPAPTVFRAEAPSPDLAQAATVVDAIQITPQEVGLVQSFLRRRDTLPAPARARIAADIATKLRPKVAGIGTDVPDEEFLELVATSKAMRR
jgi:uncharacterized RDD family membrane protein YckC